MAKREQKEPKINGGTIIDFVQWRGDVSIGYSPWGEIDSVIATMIAYANLGENELVFEKGEQLRLASLATSDLLTRLPQDGSANAVAIRNRFLADLAGSVRYRDIAVLDQVNDVDPDRDIQFSALTMQVPDVGIVVAFRGTDATPVGWKEDFMMSYMSPVPAQAASIDYLQRVADHTDGPLYLAGHSKGGNLALYSAAHTTPEIQDRIRAIYSFDGPGLDDATIESEGYRRVEPLIHSFVPYGSIVGLLMNYHPIFRVVQSNAHAIMQHDPFSWLLVGKRFLEEDSVSEGAQIMDHTIHEWLKTCTPEQREIFVTSIFSLLDKKEKGNEQAQDAELLKKTDESSKRMIRILINRLISIHAGISWDVNVRRRLVQASEELRLKLKTWQGGLERSKMVQIDNHGSGFTDATAEAERMAELGGLSAKDSLRLALMTEEMLCMAGIVTGEMQASFWIEQSGRQYELHMTAQTDMDRNKKKRLRAVARPKKSGGAGKGFQEKLRSAFERAMASKEDDVCFDFTADADRQAYEQWDGYEHSVLLQLADHVRISIHGSEAHMVVRKEFA